LVTHAHIHGLLAVHKPTGMVSKDISRWLVRRLGKLKLGHVGTLDPAASGVLPVLLGRATRLQDYLLDMPKTYEFDIRFGSETDTLDLDGQVIRETAWEHITEAQLRTAIGAFIGDIVQTPPIYSAIKYKGKPLYDYARSGAEAASSVPLEALKRSVSVSRFDLLGLSPGQGSFRVTCSKGTYVRTLAKDLAEKVGSCGTLIRLVRTKSSGVEIGAAHGLEAIEQQLDNFESLVTPLDQIDIGLPRWRSSRPGLTAKLRDGQQVVMEIQEYVSCCLDPEDGLVGGWVRPILLLNEQGEAFGVGSVRSQESGRIAIVMKRGL
jgi:tRNA pseudouridine55 synthase